VELPEQFAHETRLGNRHVIILLVMKDVDAIAKEPEVPKRVAAT
jgi:hypothetical protein